jgi:hypothetical protein
VRVRDQSKAFHRRLLQKICDGTEVYRMASVEVYTEPGRKWPGDRKVMVNGEDTTMEFALLVCVLLMNAERIRQLTYPHESGDGMFAATLRRIADGENPFDVARSEGVER